MEDVVISYIKAGWLVPHPLPKGRKFPPQGGLTGRAPGLTSEKLLDVWQKAPKEVNVGLRLQVGRQRDHEVISLDVDHYDNKRGLDNLADMEARLGSLDLDNVVRSSRRGADSMSGQYFFKVPKEIRWRQEACSHVEIVQMGHRYSVVWPSIVDDMQYQWLLGDKVVGIPLVDDLPELPEKWVAELQKGAADLSDPGVLPEYEEAVEWLSEQPGYGGKHTVKVGEMKRNAISGIPEVSAHPIMFSTIRWLVAASTEGHSGICQAIEEVASVYLTTLTTRTEGARSESVARKEVESAICYSVREVREEVRTGKRIVRGYNFDNIVIPELKFGTKQEGTE